MISFSLYFEKLGTKHLNPDGKRKAKKEKAFQQRKQYELKEAREKIHKIKEHLKELQYNIKKSSDESSYTTRSPKLLALSKIDRTNLQKLKAYDKMLFTLAHEYGHVLQWDKKTNTYHMFDYWFDLKYKNKENPYTLKEVEYAETMYYELDAWEKAKQYISIEQLHDFMNYARECLNTYKRFYFISLNINKYPPLKEVCEKMNYKLIIRPSKKRMTKKGKSFRW